MSTTPFSDLPSLAAHFRQLLQTKKFILLYAYNGTGKTRLSTEFKNLGKSDDEPDTLYFNAFTEDLFYWDNDLVNDRKRVLQMNAESRFFHGIREVEINGLIRPLVRRYADFDFQIEKVNDQLWEVYFSRDVLVNGRLETIEDIKISRGEENIFIWCFFLAIVQLAFDGAEAYQWVKYIYIDDPISSLDEHNAIIVANHLVQVYRESARFVETIISTHHNLFFNVLHYELKNHFNRQSGQYVLSANRLEGSYVIREQKGDTPAFHHVAALAQLHRVAAGDTIQTHHFNMLRTILEKTALFHGYSHFSNCIKRDPDDADGILHQRFIDLLSHGKYSLYEPQDMGDETKGYFRKILREFLTRYPFNPALFPAENAAVPTQATASATT